MKGIFIPDGLLNGFHLGKSQVRMDVRLPHCIASRTISIKAHPEGNFNSYYAFLLKEDLTGLLEGASVWLPFVLFSIVYIYIYIQFNDHPAVQNSTMAILRKASC